MDPKYAYVGLKLKGNELSLLTPRKFHQLKWNRFINNKGGVGKNILLDLRLEHINKLMKDLIKSQGAQNITDENVEKISKSIGVIESIVQSHSRDAGLIDRDSHHFNKHKFEMFKSVSKEVHCVANNFKYQSGRKLNHFSGFDKELFNKLNKVSLFNWINTLSKKWHNEMQLLKNDVA